MHRSYNEWTKSSAFYCTYCILLCPLLNGCLSEGGGLAGIIHLWCKTLAVTYLCTSFLNKGLPYNNNTFLLTSVKFRETLITFVDTDTK